MWRQVSIVLVMSTLALLAFDRWDRGNRYGWVGRIELEVEFDITDAETGDPIPGARIDIYWGSGGFNSELKNETFSLVADEQGVARRCLDRQIAGHDSGLGFRKSHSVKLPTWIYGVVATGYMPLDQIELDTLEHIAQVRRTSSEKSKLVVPISLYKKHGSSKDSR